MNYIILFFFALALAQPATAHNGVVALAVPLAPINIDGDLSDWPAAMRRYPIAQPEFGSRPKDKKDLQAFFRVGYNAAEKALYIAVEAADESIVALERGRNWDDQDGGDIYTDLKHRTKESPVRQYALWGTIRDVFASAGRASRMVCLRPRSTKSCKTAAATYGSPPPAASAATTARSSKIPTGATACRTTRN